MDVRPSTHPDSREILGLARDDRRAAEQAVAALSLEAQTDLVCSAPVALRSKVLELTPSPEEVIPLLPEAELCFTAKAMGLLDASWILEHATAGQLVASIDLDGWRGLTPNRESLREWLPALAQSGDETLLRLAREVDTELVVLMVRDRAHVMLDPKDEEWQAPEGAVTLEGQFYLLARQPGDDLADLLALLHVVFQEDYWLYFRMLQGVIWELESDLEEWALRWRTGRLEDLGFPAWDEAMRIYGYLRPGERDGMPVEGNALEVEDWVLPVFMPSLPAALENAFSVFRAAAELEEEERRGFFYAFVALANKVAVAEQMELSDAETLPQAVEIAGSVVSSGLEHLAETNGATLPDVLRRVTLERLFRVGASLLERKPPPMSKPDSPEEGTTEDA